MPWPFKPGDPILPFMARSSASSGGFSEVSAQFVQDIAPALWTPHRPARPEKSEGGRRFKLVSD